MKKTMVAAPLFCLDWNQTEGTPVGSRDTFVDEFTVTLIKSILDTLVFLFYSGARWSCCSMFPFPESRQESTCGAGVSLGCLALSSSWCEEIGQWDVYLI